MAGQTLQGTMASPEDPMAALLAALSQQSQAAQGAATQAGNTYQQAAAAPPPSLGGLSAFLPTLLSNVASTIGQNPDYSRSTQAGLEERKKTLFDARTQNLTDLRDKYNTLAEHASKLGNVEAEANWRAKIAQIDHKHDQLMEDQKNQNELAQIKETGRQARLTAGVKATEDAKKAKADAAALGSTVLDNEVKTAGNGQDYLPTTNSTSKTRSAFVRYGSDNKIPVVSPQQDAALGRLKIARDNLGSMIEAHRQIGPKTVAERFTGYAGRHAADIAEQPSYKAFHSFYEPLIEQLTALAGGAGSGLRINKSEIERLLKTAPTIDTPIPSAEAWAKQVSKFIDVTDNAVLGRAKGASPKPTSAASTTTNAVDPKVKTQALALARGGNRDSLRALIQANPALDNDPELLQAVQGGR
jgi:hypothetical protein